MLDFTDQFLASYSFLRRNVNWLKKLSIHSINMAMLNAYILYKNYSKEKKGQRQFCLEIVKHFLKTAKETPRGVLEIPEPANSPLRLGKKHFMEKFLHMEDVKETFQVRCVLCAKV